MTDIYMKALRQFHTKYNHYTAEVPHIPPTSVVELRRKLISEEAEEFDLEAYKAQHPPYNGFSRDEQIEHVVIIADALADILYVVFGTALTYGIDIESCFLEVHRSNMTKSMLKDEKSIKGKTLKGDEYRPPDLRQFIDIPSFGEE